MKEISSLFVVHHAAHVSFARHGRALAGESPEHAQVVGRIQPNTKGVHREVVSEGRWRQISGLTNRNHIRLADMKTLLEKTDKWARRRIRAVYWKQWKKVRTK